MWELRLGADSFQKNTDFFLTSSLADAWLADDQGVGDCLWKFPHWRRESPLFFFERGEYEKDLGAQFARERVALAATWTFLMDILSETDQDQIEARSACTGAHAANTAPICSQTCDLLLQFCTWFNLPNTLQSFAFLASCCSWSVSEPAEESLARALIEDLSRSFLAAFKTGTACHH